MVGNKPKAGRILAESWRILRRQRTILYLVLVTWVLSLLSLPFLRLYGLQFPPSLNSPPVFSPTHSGALIALEFVVGLVIGPFVFAGLFRSLLSLIENRSISLGDYFRLGWSGYKRGLLLLLSTILCALPFMLIILVATFVAVVLVGVAAHTGAAWATILASVVAILVYLLLLLFDIWGSMALLLIPAVGFTDPEIGALAAATRAVGLAWRYRWTVIWLSVLLGLLVLLGYVILMVLALIPALGVAVGLLVLQFPLLLSYLALLIFYRGWGHGEEEVA